MNESTCPRANVAMELCCPLQVPSFVTEEARHFISWSLTKDVVNRPSVSQLLEHPWVSQCEGEGVGGLPHISCGPSCDDMHCLQYDDSGSYGVDQCPAARYAQAAVTLGTQQTFRQVVQPSSSSATCNCITTFCFTLPILLPAATSTLPSSPTPASVRTLNTFVCSHTDHAPHGSRVGRAPRHACHGGPHRLLRGPTRHDGDPGAGGSGWQQCLWAGGHGALAAGEGWLDLFACYAGCRISYGYDAMDML